VSPDGATLVFDLLGDIYTLSATGGDARLVLWGARDESIAVVQNYSVSR